MNSDIIRSVGQLDRSLSELKILSEQNLDQADFQTVKHHAEDCIGLGKKVLENLNKKGAGR